MTPGHIAGFYDALVKRVDRNTAALRIRGLKRFFTQVQKTVPGYISPFEVMDERLVKKLNRTKKGSSTKKALHKHEAVGLLNMLRTDETIKGLADHAIALTLITSGLRAFELCSLSWGDLSYDPDGGWMADFVGKGGR